MITAVASTLKTAYKNSFNNMGESEGCNNNKKGYREITTKDCKASGAQVVLTKETSSRISPNVAALSVRSSLTCLETSSL